MPSSVMLPPSAVTAGIGVPPLETADPVVNGQLQSSPRSQSPRSPLLAKLTGLTSIAMVAALGIVIVGIIAVVGGSYDKKVVHDQLVPQKIFFPAAGSPALLPGVKQYAGQQLTTGSQAKAYANNFINVHLSRSPVDRPMHRSAQQPSPRRPTQSWLKRRQPSSKARPCVACS